MTATTASRRGSRKMWADEHHRPSLRRPGTRARSRDEALPDRLQWSVTTLWFSPGPIDFPEPHRVSIALKKHEDECGRCNPARLWREHGSPEMKAEVDRLYGEIQKRMVARHLAGRIN